eukprot:5242459-Pleurochrysis_carterae.AAC.1
MFITTDAVHFAALLVCKEAARTAFTSGKYKYRAAVQASLYPGTLMRMSLVLPCVQTGANLGCTAFFASLLRHQEKGTLGSIVYRQTDDGSDNDATITHVLHWLLVHMGV